MLGLTCAPVASAADSAEARRTENLVILDENAVKNLGLATAEAEEATFEETVFALGRIAPAAGRQAIISSRVPGRVLSVAAHVDMMIEQGAEALVIESRQAGLPPPQIPLSAPISGRVSALRVVPGQPITPDEVLVEITDLREVKALAAVPEHLAHKVKEGQQARIRATGYPEQEFTAAVAHMGASADAASGTIEAAFHVENPGEILRPGMRAEFSIVTGAREGVMAVPREAVQGDALQRFVYIRDYELEHAFVKTPVVLGAQNDRLVEVTSGLLPGDEVVTRGAYALAFAGKGTTTLKEALDAAHGHAHAEDGSELEDSDHGHGHEGEDHGHDHEHEHGHSRGLMMFFAATSGVLLGLLLLVAWQWRRSATEARSSAPDPHA